MKNDFRPVLSLSFLFLIFAGFFLWLAIETGIQTFKASSALSTPNKQWVQWAGVWTGIAFAAGFGTMLLAAIQIGLGGSVDAAMDFDETQQIHRLEKRKEWKMKKSGYGERSGYKKGGRWEMK